MSQNRGIIGHGAPTRNTFSQLRGGISGNRELIRCLRGFYSIASPFFACVRAIVILFCYSVKTWDRQQFRLVRMQGMKSFLTGLLSCFSRIRVLCAHHELQHWRRDCARRCCASPTSVTGHRVCGSLRRRTSAFHDNRKSRGVGGLWKEQSTETTEISLASHQPGSGWFTSCADSFACGPVLFSFIFWFMAAQQRFLPFRGSRCNRNLLDFRFSLQLAYDCTGENLRDLSADKAPRTLRQKLSRRNGGCLVSPCSADFPARSTTLYNNLAFYVFLHPFGLRMWYFPTPRLQLY